MFISIYADRAYRLRLTMGIILEYEQLTENKICELDINDVSQMTTLLWLMMKRENRNLTLEKVKRIVLKAKDKTEIFVSARIALNNAFTKNVDAKQEEIKSDYFDFSSYIKIAAEIGISLLELWEYTPAEFSELINANIKNHIALYIVNINVFFCIFHSLAFIFHPSLCYKWIVVFYCESRCC
jgi:hypothetical protein